MWMSHGKVRTEGKVNPIWVPLCSCPWAESQELPRKKLGMEKKATSPAQLEGCTGLPGGLRKPALTLCFLGFGTGPYLLLLTLICLAWAAENQ